MCYYEYSEMEHDVMQDVIPTLDYKAPNFNIQYMHCMNWINTECDARELKAELVLYAQSLGKADVAELIPVNRLGIEGQIAYCLNRNAKLAEGSRLRIKNLLMNWEPTAEVVEDISWQDMDATSAGRKISMTVACYSLMDNLRARVGAGKLSVKDVSDEVRRIVNNKAENKPAVIRELVKYYQDRLLDARSTPVTKDWIKPLQAILSALSLMTSNRAAVKAGARKAHARKMQSTSTDRDRKGEKAAAKVKTADNELGIKSVDPKNIVGASAVVLYNTKTRHIELYVATEGQLSMQGKSVVGWDDKVSMGKTIRKPEEVLPHWSRATTLRRFFVLGNDIRGKSWDVTGKINKHTIILKVL